MDIVLNCPACGQRLTVDEAGAGAAVNCPTCAAPLIVPEPGGAGSASVVETVSSPASVERAIEDEGEAVPAPFDEPQRAGHSPHPYLSAPLEVSPFMWILRGIGDGLRGAPILFIGLLCALIIYALAAAVLCIGDFFVIGPLLCGVWAMALGILRRQPGALGRIFDGFRTFWRAVGLGLLLMLMGVLAGLVAWGLFLVSALVLPGAWLISAGLAALVSSYPSWRLGFAAPLLVDRRLEVGESLAGSWRMTAGLAMHLAWVIFIFFGIGLGVVLAGLFVMATGLFGVGVVEAVKASQQPSHIMAALGSTIAVVALLAPLVAGLWIAVILMALAQAYAGTLGRLGQVDAITPAEKAAEMPRAMKTPPGGRSQCPQCTQPLEAGACFCSHCGARIGDSRTVRSQPALIAAVAGGAVLLVALTVLGVRSSRNSTFKRAVPGSPSPTARTAQPLDRQDPGFQAPAQQAGAGMIERQLPALTARELAGNWKTDRLASLELKERGSELGEGSFVPAEDRRFVGRMGRPIFQGQHASFQWSYLAVSGTGILERQPDGQCRIKMLCSEATAVPPRTTYQWESPPISGRRSAGSAVAKRSGTGSRGFTGSASVPYEQARQREAARQLFADGCWYSLRPRE
jgi:hypothetical protein